MVRRLVPPLLAEEGAGTIDISDYGFRSDTWMDPYTYTDPITQQQVSCRSHGRKRDAVVKRFTCQ
jgi:hypothetical protein